MLHLENGHKIKTMRLITFISTGIFIVVSACIIKKENQTQTSSLFETNWSLKKMHTDGSIENVTTKAFIKFDEAKQSAGGTGSCNSFGSDISIEENKISFKNIFSTKMYCEAVQQTENTFFELLGKVNRFEVKNNLLLLYLDKDVILEFSAE